jgi:hypothetical protein
MSGGDRSEAAKSSVMERGWLLLVLRVWCDGIRQWLLMR